MVRVLASGAVDHVFSGVMVRVLDSGDVDPGFQWCNG
jgi:MOSC domain-containing protein YiiM